ncbi:stage II sporulation protein M [Brassicibacter mesophilus]|uniref:stage II sporulation protein M n=1 Tax=Brassicibacter mesophilus TaxID=745119 RepID=UPI003D1C509D
MKIKEFVYKHINNNFLLYFLLVLFLMIGISAGAITVSVIDNSQKQEMISFLNSFFKILNQNNVDSFILLKHSLLNNVQTLFFIWLLGIIVIGVPLVMGIVMLRGFIIGFTVGFLVNELGFKGFVFSILAILPQNIFVIPGIIIISAISISFSLKTIKNKINRKNRYNFTAELIRYSLITVSLSILLILGSLIEAYITPVFMKLILGYVS